MDKPQKIAQLDELSAAISSSAIVLCADYRGLTVAQVTQFRSKLRSAKCQARVVKNTLGRIATKRSLKANSEAQLDLMLKTLKGPSMLLYSSVDPVAPAKIVAEYVKTNPKLQIKGAFVDGSFLDMAGVVNLSTMPGKEELLGQLLNIIQSSATNLVRVLQGNSEKVVRVLEAQRKNLEAA